MRTRAVVVATAVTSVAAPAFACEPIVPLVSVFFPLGQALRIGGWMLLAVVIVKCLAFAAMQKTMRFVVAAFAMFVANVVSSFVGLLATLGMAVPQLILVSLVAVFFLSLLPARRLVELWPKGRHVSPSGIAAAAVLLFLGSIIGFMAAQAALASERMWLYWVLKLVYVELALAISISLTTFWEEYVVWRMARRDRSERSFLVPVLRANLYVILVVMLVAAAVVLPERLRSADFLISILRGL